MSDQITYAECTAREIFRHAELLRVRPDGVWLRDPDAQGIPMGAVDGPEGQMEETARNMLRGLSHPERQAFVEHPLGFTSKPGNGVLPPKSQPLLPIHFTAKELAACLFVGAASVYASERFGSIELGELDETALQSLDKDTFADHAIRCAYAEFRKALEVVGPPDPSHHRSVWPRTKVLNKVLGKGRARLGVDHKLAKLNERLEADLSDQKCKLEEALAPLKKAVAAGDDTAIQRAIALREAAELQDAKSREFANLEREKIWQAFTHWREQDPGYTGPRKEARKARNAANDADKAWRTAILRHLLSCDQTAPEAPAQGLTSRAGQADQGSGAQQSEAVAQAAQTGRVHTTKGRRSSLSAIISQAINRAADPTDWQSAWAALVDMASSGKPPPPLIGYVEGEGVQYKADKAGGDGSPEYLAREAFRGRFRRQSEKLAGNGR
jgi:hypothetical protein